MLIGWPTAKKLKNESKIQTSIYLYFDYGDIIMTLEAIQLEKCGFSTIKSSWWHHRDYFWGKLFFLHVLFYGSETSYLKPRIQNIS